MIFFLINFQYLKVNIKQIFKQLKTKSSLHRTFFKLLSEFSIKNYGIRFGSFFQCRYKVYQKYIYTLVCFEVQYKICSPRILLLLLHSMARGFAEGNKALALGACWEAKSRYTLSQSAADADTRSESKKLIDACSRHGVPPHGGRVQRLFCATPVLCRVASSEKM